MLEPEEDLTLNNVKVVGQSHGGGAKVYGWPLVTSLLVEGSRPEWQ